MTPDQLASEVETRVDLRRLVGRLDDPPTPGEYREHGQYGIATVYEHWDGWRDAISDAGGDPSLLPGGRENMDAIGKWDDLVHGIREAETTHDWSLLLSDHLRFGNSKMQERIAIFNLASATGCVNLNTSHCQVGDGECYAYCDEQLFPHTLLFRRRQAYLWDCLDPDTFADAFLAAVDRKQSPVDYLRFNESGDLRHQWDVHRVDRIAERLSSHGITTFTFTASDHVDLPPQEDRHVVVNASNEAVRNPDQRFNVVEDAADVPEDSYQCPFPEEGTKCGECLACLHSGGDGDVYEVLRERNHA